VIFLDRQNVECPADRPYLSKWHILRTGKNDYSHIKMVYGCVTAATPAPTAEPTAEPTADPTAEPTTEPTTPAPTRVDQVFPDTSKETAMVFVVDVSTSMAVRNVIDHMKDEFKNTVQNLQERQHFSMVKFESVATPWKDHLLTVNATNVQ